MEIETTNGFIPIRDLTYSHVLAVPVRTRNNGAVHTLYTDMLHFREGSCDVTIFSSGKFIMRL